MAEATTAIMIMRAVPIVKIQCRFRIFQYPGIAVNAGRFSRDDLGLIDISFAAVDPKELNKISNVSSFEQEEKKKSASAISKEKEKSKRGSAGLSKYTFEELNILTVPSS